MTGTVRVYGEPAGVRVDSGVRAGSEVGTAYDPMLAKVIAHGPDRATAIDRLDRALATYAIAGVTTNAAFTRALLARDDVRAGEQDTGLLERVLHELATPAPDDLACRRRSSRRRERSSRRALAPRARGPRRGAVHDGTVTIGERVWSGAAIRLDGDRAHVTLDGVTRRYAIALDGDEAVFVFRDGHHAEVRTQRVARAGAAALSGSLEAPMPGTVLLVNVADGDTVGEGDVLLVLESMKMELSIVAPYAGRVAGLQLAPGDAVKRHQPLVAVVAPDEEEQTP